MKLCARLNELGARYIVIGGFAVITSGYPRSTMDIDFVIDTSLENEALVYQALEILPDQAVKELLPGEVSQYSVIRVGDEICVDLMASACGIGYEEAIKDSVIRTIDGVPIPFASPRLLWRMKEKTYREKDAPDLLFLRQQYGDEIFGPDR
ncbi:MAG: hypothetical protein EHM17_11035 [Verrucomicrobiaceae bacterium]|nr:MAG: hypothetical protein EHM17_15535 [Verrucomicrobiaceae bacterium]RPJ33221.1 MAG: hypothetical protein EHM17_11035 [Verrucomicrobiaceae bacterium]